MIDSAPPESHMYINSPRTTDEVRDRFLCPTAIGARVEDGNTAAGIDDGTAGVGHWEQAVFYVRACPCVRSDLFCFLVP